MLRFVLNLRRPRRSGRQSLEGSVLRDGLAIADPHTDDVQGNLTRQFGLAAGPHVMKEFRPGSEAGSLDDPQQLSP